MDLEIDYTISSGKNLNKVFERKIFLKKKIERLEIALAHTKSLLEESKKEHSLAREVEHNLLKNEKLVKEKKWYEKFRWAYTSGDFLILGGKDAKNNELLIKKHLAEKDLYFHADIHGAPHVVLKAGNSPFEEKDKEEAAIFASCFSSAWKSKIYSVDVYSVSPEQVTKTANSGESLGTGAFVIRGKREYFRKNEMKLGVGVSKEYGLMVASINSIKKHCNYFITLMPGDKKKSDITREIKLRLEKHIPNTQVSVDDLQNLLPSGDFDIEY